MKNTVTPPRNAAQPGLSSTLKIYGAKKLPTVKVKLQGGDKELIINADTYDPDVHERLD